MIRIRSANPYTIKPYQSCLMKENRFKQYIIQIKTMLSNDCCVLSRTLTHEVLYCDLSVPRAWLEPAHSLFRISGFGATWHLDVE
jgi:hypothetical protein